MRYNIKKSYFFLLLAIAGLGAFSISTSVFADSLQRLSNNDLYEFSLLSLKESALELAKKNSVLARKNNELQAKIKSLTAQLRSMQDEGDRLIGRLSKNKSSATDVSIEQKINANQVRIEQLTREQAGLERKITLHSKIKEETQKKTSSIELEIVELNQKVRSYQDGLEDQGFVIDKNSLAVEIEDNKKENIALNNRLKQLQAEYQKPLQLLEDLKEQQSQFMRSLDSRQAEFNLVIEKGNALQRDMDILAQERDIKLKDLADEIAQLKAQYQELDDIYAQADKKLTDRTLNLELIAKEEKELIENLLVIRRENDTLQREYSSLQEKIK